MKTHYTPRTPDRKIPSERKVESLINSLSSERVFASYGSIIFNPEEIYSDIREMDSIIKRYGNVSAPSYARRDRAEAAMPLIRETSH